MAVRFDSDTDFYTATKGLPGSIFTVTCWVYLAVDRNAYSGIWDFNDNSVGKVQLLTDLSGTNLSIWDSNGAYGSLQLTVGTWYKIGVVVNNTSLSYYTASEGNALTLNFSGSFVAVSGITRLRIGNTIANEWGNVRIESFKVWNAALSLSELELELATLNNVRTANLLHNHKFEVSETVDYSGNNNTLTAGTTSTTTESGPAALDGGGPPVDPQSAGSHNSDATSQMGVF